MSDTCPVCGLPAGARAMGDALESHISDYNDPHRTLSRVPRTYYGVGAPLVTDGYKEGDWYIDVPARVVYSCASENTASGTVLSWVPASTATAVTASDLASALSRYVLSADLDQALARYVTSASAAGFVTQDDLSGRGYATRSWVTSSALSGYATESWVSGLGYVTSAALAQALAPYVSGDALSRTLSGYYDSSAADARFALKSDVSSLLDAAGVGALLDAGYVYRSPTSPGVYPERNLDVVLSAYVTSSAAAAAYLAKTDAAATYATKTELAAGLAGTLAASDLASALSPYLLASAAASAYLSRADAAVEYVTPSGLESVLEDYARVSDLPTGFATREWVSAGFVSRLELNGYVTGAVLADALSSRVTHDELDGRLASYKTAAQCDSTYVTPSYLAANRYLAEGAGYFSGFVTRTGNGDRDIDGILRAWPVASLALGETKPPQAGVVKAALNAEASARANLAETVASLVVTGGANLLKDISETVSHTISGTSVAMLKLYDSATNWIDTTNALVVGDRIRISLPASPGAGVARDFLFCVTFSHATAVGQVPHQIDVIRNRDGTVPQFVSYVNRPFDLKGVVYGTTVIWGFTEMTSGKFAVTRKILYPVESGYGV